MVHTGQLGKSSYKESIPVPVICNGCCHGYSNFIDIS